MKRFRFAICLVGCMAFLFGGCAESLGNGQSAPPTDSWEQSRQQAAAIQQQIDADRARREADQQAEDQRQAEQAKQLQDQINAQYQRIMNP